MYFPRSILSNNRLQGTLLGEVIGSIVLTRNSIIVDHDLDTVVGNGVLNIFLPPLSISIAVASDEAFVCPKGPFHSVQSSSGILISIATTTE